MNDPFERRKSAGSFSLPEGSTGSIREMCPRGDHLEIYTESQTFMAQTPESIDPERTNPNVPWVIVKTDDVGCGHPAVARTFIMAHHVMKQARFDHSVDKDAVLNQMHTIKGLLVICSNCAQLFTAQVKSEMEAFEASQGRLSANSPALERFPRVQDFEGQLTSLLVNAKRAVREVCLLMGMFFPFSRPHSSLAHVVRELKTLRGADDELAQFVAGRVAGCGRIAALRDGQEHQGTTCERLYTDNFRMMPNNQIRAPVWYVGTQNPFDIVAEINAISEFLTELAELVFVACVSVNLSDSFPRMVFQQVPEPPEHCPIRHELMVDFSQFTFKAEPNAK